MSVGSALVCAMRESHLTAGAVLYSVLRDATRREEWDCKDKRPHHTHTFEGATDTITDKQLEKDLMIFASSCWFLWKGPQISKRDYASMTKGHSPPAWVKKAGIPYSSDEATKKYAAKFGVKTVVGY